MNLYKEEEYLQLSGIQHFAFCKRQWALAYIELQWSDNLRTVEGEILHENAHNSFSMDKRREIITSRGMAIQSSELGVSGECDVVEFHKSSKGIEIYGREGLYQVIPIEYKKGKPKENDIDLLQLTAQAICLEEMLCCSIDTGYIYYGEIRRRIKVEFTEDMRNKVKSIFREMHGYYERRYTPRVKISKSCNACSLKNICLPVLCKDKSVKTYIDNRLKEGM